MGPVLFVREVLGVEPDDWQIGVLKAYGRGERRISIRSCHGPGKTAVAAWLVIVNLVTRLPQKTVATAPTTAQLDDALVSEVKMWMNRLPATIKDLFEIKTRRIELRSAPDECFFSARTSRAEKPEALQGIHADEGHVLLIADEASGVPEPIFEAAAGSMSGHNATTLLLSNPVRTSGFFYDTHHKLHDMWYTVHVSHADSPRVADDFVEDIARRYGEDSNAFRIRCLGEFPRADDDVIIPFELIVAASERDIIMRPGAEVWGVDVARFGDDSSTLVKRRPRHLLPDIKEWKDIDTMQLCGRVKFEYDNTQPSERPEEILVDVIGLGAGVVDRLMELKLPVRGINVSETAAASDLYRNLRTELWFEAREWFAGKDVTIPKSRDRDDPVEKLITELSLLRYGYTSNGKLMAESKAELKKRGHKSPNFADAFVITFASAAATMTFGSHIGKNVGWNEPLKRNLKGIV
jgi:hypothetical protein